MLQKLFFENFFFTRRPYIDVLTFLKIKIKKIIIKSCKFKKSRKITVKFDNRYFNFLTVHPIFKNYKNSFSTQSLEPFMRKVQNNGIFTIVPLFQNSNFKATVIENVDILYYA